MVTTYCWVLPTCFAQVAKEEPTHPGGSWLCRITLPSVLAYTILLICWRRQTLQCMPSIQPLWYIVTVFFKTEIISLINSEVSIRRRRGGKRSWHECRVWSCHFHHCVLKKIFLQLMTCLFLLPPLQHHFISFQSQRAPMNIKELEPLQILALMWVHKCCVQSYLLIWLPLYHPHPCSTQVVASW